MMRQQQKQFNHEGHKEHKGKLRFLDFFAEKILSALSAFVVKKIVLIREISGEAKCQIYP